MNTPILFFHYAIFVVPALLIGMWTSFAFRTRAWVFFVWLPVVGFFAWSTLMLIGETFTVLFSGGPETGFAGLALAYFVPALAISVTGLVIAVRVTPRRVAWRWTVVAPAFLLWTAAIFVLDNANGTFIHIGLSSLEGKPLGKVRTTLFILEDGRTRGGNGSVLTGDELENIEVQLSPNQSVELHFEPVPSPSTRPYQPPFYYMLKTEFLRGARDQVAVRHSWWRRVGEVQISEGYTEIVPATHDMRISLEILPNESLDPKPRLGKIRAAILAALHRSLQGSDFTPNCHNLESIELIPLLVQTYKENEKQRHGVIDALAVVAEVLSDLDKGSKLLLLNGESYYSHEKTAYEIQQLRVWADGSSETKNDKPQVRRLVEAKIAACAQELTDFVFEELPTDVAVLKVLGNLRQLGRASIPRVLEKVRAKPPASWKEIADWTYNLRLLGIHFGDLEPLLDSENPMLVLLAVEIAPDSEIFGANAGKALQRLQIAYPNMKEEGVRQRADMFMKRIKAHAHTDE